MGDHDLPEDIAALVGDDLNRSTPAKLGPDFEELVESIDEELGAQIAIGRLGDINPDLRQITEVAKLIADVVDRVYRLERRPKPSSDQSHAQVESAEELEAIVEELVDHWCERRALRPLRQILAGWPSPLRLTDDFAELRAALRNVVGVARADLTAEEVETIQLAVASIDAAIQRTNDPATGDIPAR